MTRKLLVAASIDGPLGMNSQKITSLADPTASTDAATKNYVDSLVAAGAWSTYTPTWSSTGVAPVIGNGTLAGRYKQQGKVVHYEVLMIAGTTTTFGTGTWTFAVPVTGRTPSTFRPMGTCRMVDVSATAVYNGFVTSNDGLVVAANTSASPSASVSATVPYAWANTDYFYAAGVYEAA
jgi:hypothetical protein